MSPVWVILLISGVVATPNWAGTFCENEDPTRKFLSGRGCLSFTTTPASGASVSTVSQDILISFDTTEDVYFLPPCPIATDPLVLSQANLASLAAGNQNGVECTARGDCSSFTENTWPWNNWVTQGARAPSCNAYSSFRNGVYLVSGTTAKYASAVTVHDTKSFTLTFPGLTDNTCWSLVVAPVFFLKRPWGNHYYNIDLQSRTQFVTGTGAATCLTFPALPPQVKQCFDSGSIPDPLTGLTSTAPATSTSSAALVSGVECPAGTGDCLKITLDLRSDDATHTATITQAHDGTSTQTLMTNVVVTITQPEEPVRVVPFQLDVTKHPVFEAYGIQRKAQIYGSAEQRFTQEEWITFRSYITANALINPGAFENWHPAPNGQYINYTKYDPTTNPDYSGANFGSMPKFINAPWCSPSQPGCGSASFAGTPTHLAQFYPPGNLRDQIAADGGDLANIGVTDIPGSHLTLLLNYNSASDCSSVYALDLSEDCPLGSVRIPHAPVIDGVINQLQLWLAADKGDTIDIFSTHGLHTSASLTVDVDGVAVTLTDEAQKKHVGNTVAAQLEPTLFSTPKWDERMMVERSADTSNPSNWHFRDKAAVGVNTEVASDDTHPMLWKLAANVQKNAGTFCTAPPHSLQDDADTLYAKFRDSTQSMLAIPEADRKRLTGTMSAATKTKYGLTSSNRFHVDMAASNTLATDPAMAGFMYTETAESPPVDKTVHFVVDYYPCIVPTCGYDPVGSDGARSGGLSAVVMVADHNVLTIYAPHPGFKTCDPTTCGIYGWCGSGSECVCPAPRTNPGCACPGADQYGRDCSKTCTAATTCSGHGQCHPSTGDCVCDQTWQGAACGDNRCTTRPADGSLAPLNFYDATRSCKAGADRRCTTFTFHGCTYDVCQCICTKVTCVEADLLPL